MKIKLFLSLMLVGFLSFANAQTAEQLAMTAIEQEIPLIKNHDFVNYTLFPIDNSQNGNTGLTQNTVTEPHASETKQMTKNIAIGAMLEISKNLQNGTLLQPSKDVVFSKMSGNPATDQAMMDKVILYIQEVLN